jgi:ATP-binding cassette subfamily B protein
MNAPAIGIRSFEVPKLDPGILREVGRFWWPPARLGEGLEALARVGGLPCRAGAEPLGAPPGDMADQPDWMEWASDQLGVEAEAVETPIPETAELLRRAGPAIIRWWPEELGPGFLLVISARGGRVRLIGPDLRARTCSKDSLRSALCWPSEAPLIPEIDHFLAQAGVEGPRRSAVRTALLRDRLASARLVGVWILRPSPSTSLWRQLVHAGVPGRIGVVLAVFAVVYALEIAGWGLIGKAALEGRLDFGWLAAWLLLILTIVPWRMVGGWFGATFSLDISRILKARLLTGALRMDPEAVIRQGVGRLLGRVMEAQALESLVVSGAMSVVVSVLELGFAAMLLGAGAAGKTHLSLLALFTAATVVLSWRYYRSLDAWSSQRLDMTNGLIEGMVGHRTRLAQERPDRRDLAEDRELQGYLAASKSMDLASVSVLAALPFAWAVVGILGLVPALVAHIGPSSAAIGISLGGLLIAQRAFSGISGGLAGLGRAAFSWRQVSAIFRSGRAEPTPGPFLTRAQLRGGAASPLIEAHGLSFAYSPGGRAVVSGIDLTLQQGERVLLEGSSGGGKSTLAALLTGLHAPDAGLLLLNGLDRHTLGDNWQRLSTAAPQFHENHILSGTLAFNLLMGRAWPAAPADLREAEALCGELGLADLLRRMPAGLQQRVGETGWQLSHGERSRIFLARALLQDAPLTIMDESFAALDPETLDLCLKVTLRRARALVVIAHP